MKCPKCQATNPETARYCNSCAFPLPSSEEISITKTLVTPREELTRGTTFANRYEIIEELGEGGMGTVYRVFDKKIKEEVALKLLKPEIAADKRTIERFSNELRFARKITHKNVCRMHDLNEEEKTHYITMEYVPGEDLKSFIRRGEKLTVGKAISIAKQVCEGLGEAHKLGVIHRDLKPRNIMIDKEGNAKIMDFGIARSMRGEGVTGEGAMIGTPEYMSPEQVEGKKADQRSDIYALGVILFEMLTGRIPFEGETPISIAVKHKTEAPPNPKNLNPQIPENLNAAILKCLEKQRTGRYQTAEELYFELTNIEEGIPTTERVIPRRRPFTSMEISVQFKLKKLFIPAFILIAVIIAGLIIWHPWIKEKTVSQVPSDIPSVAILYFKNNTGDEDLDIWREGFCEMLITDLSLSKNVRILPSDLLFGILKRNDLIETENYTQEDLKKIADEGGVSHIVQGTLNKAGGNFRIDIRLQNIETLEIIGTGRAEGLGEENLFSMADELTMKIKEYLKFTEEQIAADVDKGMEEITTRSPEAYKYFVEGWKNLLIADFDKAITYFEKAVATDPEFAQACYRLSVAYYNRGMMNESRKYLQKAIELRDRLSERDRLNLQIMSHIGSDKTWDKAIEAYKKLIQLYPLDWIPYNDLAYRYQFLGEWDRSIDLIKAILNKDLPKEIPYPYWLLVQAYNTKGRYNEAKKVLEDYLDNYGDNAWILAQLGWTFLYLDEYELAMSEVDKALALGTSPTPPMRKAFLFHWKGDFTKAEDMYLGLIERKDPTYEYDAYNYLAYLSAEQGKFEKAKNLLKQGREMSSRMGNKEKEWKSRFDLAYFLLASGNLQKALEECDGAWVFALDPDGRTIYRQILLLHLKGLILSCQKSIEEAEEVAEELKILIESSLYKLAIPFNFHLRGRIELEKENFSDAIIHLEKAVSMLPHQTTWPRDDDWSYFKEVLALAYFKAGDLEKALKEYQEITALKTGRIRYGDTYAKSFYMLGKIYEQTDNKDKAIEHYQKFLDLWKNADPGMVQVEDAKKRISVLQGP